MSELEKELQQIEAQYEEEFGDASENEEEANAQDKPDQSMGGQKFSNARLVFPIIYFYLLQSVCIA